nr:retrovirus-related Pol polyprotein from transposon TNT 1-94 [Tanacetum cinerariifolium]
PDDTNILAGTQAKDLDSECDEQGILVPSFPSNSFLGPTVPDVSAPMENNLDYAEELARLQRQEYEAHSAAAKHGFDFFVDTVALLPQANIEIHRNLVPAAGDPTSGIVPTGGVPAGSDPASSVPTGGVLAGSSIPASSVPTGGVLAGSSIPASSITTGGFLAGSSIPASSVPTGGFLASSSIPASSVPTSGVLAGSSVPASYVPEGNFPARRVPAGGILAGRLVSTDSGASSVPAASVLVPVVVSTDSAAISPLPPILGDLQSPVQTRSTVQKSKFGESAFISYVQNQNRTNHADHLHCLFACFLSQLEPSSVANALADLDWVAAMQEEMQQFYHQQVLKLVPLPAEKIAIGTKWILKNKRDARGIVVRNKAQLVAQGHRQEEGIDYDEVFAPVARIESIRIFLAFASYTGFMVYQMDVKSAFLYGEIEEDVYVTQPKVFEDTYNPKHVYRVVKALYGLHQAPRAWYARLSTFLLKHNYRKGTINKTLFLKKDSRHIILVQVYVDDIIFGSTNKAWCDEFEVLMKGEFQMSAMGELTFFLGLQVHQLPDGIIISQDKYVKDMLKKFDMENSNVTVDPVATMRINSIHPQSHILGDLQSPEQTRKPSSVANTLVDPDWVAAMQEEMQQFYHQQVWKLIPLPAGKIAIGTKWILKNKRDARGIVVYVDDIIFGSTNKAWCDEFEVLMKGEFEMSAMGELTFFLGLQVKQLPNEIFISQDNLPAGSYSFLLLDWFLLVVVLPVREHSPVREPTPVREPSPHPKPKPTPDSPIPLSPPPSSVAVGPTISSGPPSPSRHPSGPDDIREGGGDFASSLPSNEAPQTLAATVAGRAEDSAALTALTLKLDECLHRVATLENELGITKKAPQEAVYFFFSAHVSETIPPGVRVPAAATTIPADSLMDAAVHAAAAPSFSIPTAADKGKALMVDNSPHADLLSEHEREELAQKAQAESVASPTAHGQEMSDQRRRELDAAQLIYTEANWLDLLAKIATNSALSKQLLGDDITEENMNERLGMLLMPKRRERAEQSRVKPMTKTQQRDYMRDFMKNCSASVHSTFRPKPTLDAPPAKRANQAAPQVPAISTQDPAGVLVAPLIPDDASLLAASSSDPAAVSVPAEPMEMVPSHLGSVHAYHNMTGHTKHFTTLREILHMVERIDLQRLLGAVDALYQSEEPDTFSLLLWGDLHMLFQSLDDTDALHFWRTQDSWRIRSWRLYPQAQVYVLEMV